MADGPRARIWVVCQAELCGFNASFPLAFGQNVDAVSVLQNTDFIRQLLQHDLDTYKLEVQEGQSNYHPLVMRGFPLYDQIVMNDTLRLICTALANASGQNAQPVARSSRQSLTSASRPAASSQRQNGRKAPSPRLGSPKRENSIEVIEISGDSDSEEQEQPMASTSSIQRPNRPMVEMPARPDPDARQRKKRRIEETPQSESPPPPPKPKITLSAPLPSPEKGLPPHKVTNFVKKAASSDTLPSSKNTRRQLIYSAPSTTLVSDDEDVPPAAEPQAPVSRPKTALERELEWTLPSDPLKPPQDWGSVKWYQGRKSETWDIYQSRLSLEGANPDIDSLATFMKDNKPDSPSPWIIEGDQICDPEHSIESFSAGGPTKPHFVAYHKAKTISLDQQRNQVALQCGNQTWQLELADSDFGQPSVVLWDRFESLKRANPVSLRHVSPYTHDFLFKHEPLFATALVPPKAAFLGHSKALLEIKDLRTQNRCLTVSYEGQTLKIDKVPVHITLQGFLDRLGDPIGEFNYSQTHLFADGGAIEATKPASLRRRLFALPNTWRGRLSVVKGSKANATATNKRQRR